MAFNKINNSTDAFTYLTNQSTILRAADSNEITVHGVNVITKTPSKGDVLCITRKTDTTGKLLGPDKQDIVWMKGETINYKLFPASLYEPVGIVYKVRGKCAYIKYGYEATGQSFSNIYRFAYGVPAVYGTKRFNVDISVTQYYVNNGVKNHKIYYLSNKTLTFSGTATALTNVAKQLNNIFKNNTSEVTYSSGNIELSAEYIPKLATPEGTDTNITEADGNGLYINIKHDDSQLSTDSIVLSITDSNSGNPVGTVNTSFANNITGEDSVKLYNDNKYSLTDYIDYIQKGNFKETYKYYYDGGVVPSSTASDTTDIVNYTSFINSKYCYDLRTKYETYDNYIKSRMPRYPAPVNTITGVDNGKKLTQIFANTTYVDVSGNKQQIYEAVNYCNSINCNHVKLSTGCWYIPTVSDMIDIMWDVETDDNGKYIDMLSTVILKLNNNISDGEGGFKFTPMQFENYVQHGSIERLTCVKSTNNNVYVYSNYNGISTTTPYNKRADLHIVSAIGPRIFTTPITKIEF